MATVSQKVSLTGITSKGEISVFATLSNPATSATQGTDTTPVTTTTYVARVYIDSNTTLTGISILNGSAVAGNATVALYDNTGRVVAQSASTAQAGTAAFQQIPFAAPYRAQGPGLYFVGVQFNNTGARFRTHAVGNATTATITGGTYGTFTAFTSPNSFTANVGPIAETY